MPDRTTSTSTGSCTQGTVGDVVPTLAAIPSGHEGCADRQRLPPAGRAGLRRPDRRHRRARPARAVVGRADVARRWRSGPGPRPPASTRSGIAPGERVAVVSQNSARLLHQLLRRQRQRAHPRADQLPAGPARGRLHRRALRRRGCCIVDPELDERAVRRRGRAPLRDRRRERRRALPVRRRARAVGAGRGRHREHQLHQRHHGPAEGRAADPPQHLDQRGDVRLAGRASTTATSTCTRCRSSTATAGACRTRSPAWAGATSSSARSTAPRSSAASSATA